MQLKYQAKLDELGYNPDKLKKEIKKNIELLLGVVEDYNTQMTDFEQMADGDEKSQKADELNDLFQDIQQMDETLEATIEQFVNGRREMGQRLAQSRGLKTTAVQTQTAAPKAKSTPPVPPTSVSVQTPTPPTQTEPVKATVIEPQPEKKKGFGLLLGAIVLGALGLGAYMWSKDSD